MKHEVLSNIGIQSWEARYPLPGAKNSLQYHQFQLLKNNHPWGFLFLDALETDVSAQELLSAILKALNMECCVFNGSEIENHAMIIIMGMKLGENLQRRYPNAIVTYHPNDLVANPDLKRDVWMSLKKFK